MFLAFKNKDEITPLCKKVATIEKVITNHKKSCET